MIRRAIAWYLDYLYVGFWQSRRVLTRYKKSRYQRLASDKPSIILIPGIYERWHFMKPIADVLYQAGYSVHVVEGLGLNRGRIDQMATRVRKYMDEQGIADCIIVAHSKGGLIGKWLLVHDNLDGAIKGLVAISTPFSGSVYAYLTPLRSIREFAPTSRIVSELLANHLVNNKITSIYGTFDPHIPKGSHLEGAGNIQIPVMGHFRIIGDAAVQRAVLETVKRAQGDGNVVVDGRK